MCFKFVKPESREKKGINKLLFIKRVNDHQTQCKGLNIKEKHIEMEKEGIPVRIV